MQAGKYFDIIVQARARSSHPAERIVLAANAIGPALEAAFPEAEISAGRDIHDRCIGFFFQLEPTFNTAAELGAYVDSAVERTCEAVRGLELLGQDILIHVGDSETSIMKEEWALPDHIFHRVIEPAAPS
jgi:hypothetical protein